MHPKVHNFHSTETPKIPKEIPETFAYPYDEGYVVLHRPYAFKQWLEKYADTIEAGPSPGCAFRYRSLDTFCLKKLGVGSKRYRDI
jgi:hypothetical protein